MRKLLTLLLLFTSYSAFSGVSFVDSFDVSFQETNPFGLAFSSDGTKMFVVGYTGDDVNEYTLTTGFDVSTASFVDSFDIGSQETSPNGLAFSADGTKMFVVGYTGDDVNEYTLTTGFDVSTASFVDSFDVSSQETNPFGLAFSSDGTKMFVVGTTGDDVNEYTLTTGFDVSTASFVDSFDISSQVTSPRALAFNTDGTKMFVVGYTGDDVNEYTLTTGFDVSTASFVDSFDVSSQDTSPNGLAFSADGTKMFVVGYIGDDVNEYTLTTGFELINTAPTLSSSSPSDGATGVAVDANIVLTFSEAVDVESGNIVIKKSSDDSTVETFDVTGSLVTGTGTTEITINPSTTLDGETSYYITIAATAFDDVDSASYAGITDSTTLNFTTADVGDPTLSSSSPADGATGVALDANIVLTFSEAVDVESGNIVIKKSSDDSTVETFDVTGSLVTGTGTTEITINPSTTLDGETSYYITIAATAFDDDSSNSYAGITDSTTLNFTTADVSDPTLSSSSPSDGATGVAVDANIVLTFSEAVDVESGNIVIKKSSDDSTVETFDVTGSLVTGTGTTEITINPSTTLDGETSYYITIAATAFDDDSSNSYAGITDSTTLNFTTADVGDPTLSSSSPSDGATGVAVDANIVLTFSEAMDVESGNITLKKSSDDSTVETFDVTGSLVTGTGTTEITINPSTTLDGETSYYITIADTAFDDDSSNSYAGITDSTTLNFTTADVSDPTLSSSSPSDGATGVAVDANIVLTFSEAVDVESGNIVIKKSSDDSTVETFDVTGSLVTGTGTTEITINPSTTLDGETSYYITIADTAFDDDSSNSYAGITDSTTLNFTTVVTNLPSPLDKKDVIGSIEAWSNISTEWLKFSIDNAFDRINWLNRQRGSNQTSHQGIKLSFFDTLIDKIMNNLPGTALRDIDAVDTAASLIGSSNATLDEVSDNAESKANNIAINEATRLREALIGSLNPSFGPVIGDWSVWTKGRIVIGKTDASTTASKQEIDVQSISLGIDRPVGDGDELMGFVLSIGQNNNDIGIASTNVKSDNYSLSNYNVIKLNNNTKIENVFGVSHLEFDTLRSDGSDILTGKRKAKQLFLSTTFKPEDTRYVGNWKVSPYSKVLLANTRLNSFSESGGATALTFNKQYVKDAGLSVGMDINSTVTVNNATINPYAKLEYTRSSSKTSASMHYNSEDASSYTYTANLNKQIKNWKLKLGADLITESGWNSSVSYTREQPFGSGQASKYSNSFSFNAGIQF